MAGNNMAVATIAYGTWTLNYVSIVRSSIYVTHYGKINHSRLFMKIAFWV